MDACCEHHDNLGGKLHAVEYTSGDCGSLRLLTVQQMVSGVAAMVAPVAVQDQAQAYAKLKNPVPYYAPENGNNDTLIGWGTKEYCCGHCPTLRADLLERVRLEALEAAAEEQRKAEALAEARRLVAAADQGTPAA